MNKKNETELAPLMLNDEQLFELSTSEIITHLREIGINPFQGKGEEAREHDHQISKHSNKQNQKNKFICSNENDLNFIHVLNCPSESVSDGARQKVSGKNGSVGASGSSSKENKSRHKNDNQNLRFHNQALDEKEFDIFEKESRNPLFTKTEAAHRNMNIKTYESQPHIKTKCTGTTDVHAISNQETAETLRSTSKKNHSGKFTSPKNLLFRICLLKKNRKLFKILNCSTKDCTLCTKKNLQTVIRENLDKKYLTSRESYNVKVINDIIYNENTHIVSVFKDYLIYDDVSEFLKRFYKKGESQHRLPKIYDFYDKYSKVFPNYVILPENKYMFKNIERKQRLIDEQQRLISDIRKKKSRVKLNESDDENKIFTTNFLYDLNQKTREESRKEFEDSLCQISESQMQSYMKNNKNRKKRPKDESRLDDLNLQDLVEKFIAKDSQSLINVTYNQKQQPEEIKKSELLFGKKISEIGREQVFIDKSHSKRRESNTPTKPQFPPNPKQKQSEDKQIIHVKSRSEDFFGHGQMKKNLITRAIYDNKIDRKLSGKNNTGYKQTNEPMTTKNQNVETRNLNKIEVPDLNKKDEYNHYLTDRFHKSIKTTDLHTLKGMDQNSHVPNTVKNIPSARECWGTPKKKQSQKATAAMGNIERPERKPSKEKTHSKEPLKLKISANKYYTESNNYNAVSARGHGPIAQTTRNATPGRLDPKIGSIIKNRADDKIKPILSARNSSKGKYSTEELRLNQAGFRKYGDVHGNPAPKNPQTNSHQNILTYNKLHSGTQLNQIPEKKTQEEKKRSNLKINKKEIENYLLNKELLSEPVTSSHVSLNNKKNERNPTPLRTQPQESKIRERTSSNYKHTNTQNPSQQLKEYKDYYLKKKSQTTAQTPRKTPTKHTMFDKDNPNPHISLKPKPITKRPSSKQGNKTPSYTSASKQQKTLPSSTKHPQTHTRTHSDASNIYNTNHLYNTIKSTKAALNIDIDSINKQVHKKIYSDIRTLRSSRTTATTAATTTTNTANVSTNPSTRHHLNHHSPDKLKPFRSDYLNSIKHRSANVHNLNINTQNHLHNGAGLQQNVPDNLNPNMNVNVNANANGNGSQGSCGEEREDNAQRSLKYSKSMGSLQKSKQAKDRITHYNNNNNNMNRDAGNEGSNHSSIPSNTSQPHGHVGCYNQYGQTSRHGRTSGVGGEAKEKEIMKKNGFSKGFYGERMERGERNPERMERNRSGARALGAGFPCSNSNSNSHSNAQSTGGKKSGAISARNSVGKSKPKANPQNAASVQGYGQLYNHIQHKNFYYQQFIHPVKK